MRTHKRPRQRCSAPGSDSREGTDVTKTLTRATDVLDRITEPQLRAVCYLRVSTEEQLKGYGISYADKRTKEYVEKKSWGYVDTFEDGGVSGSLGAEERPNLKRLMRLARQEPRPFDVVVVNEGRAIGRTDRAYYQWVWELQDLGIFVADARRDIDNTTEAGEEAMREEADYAFKEYKRIRARTQNGIQEKAEQGGYAGGRPRYGYRVENKGQKGESRLVVDDCGCRGECFLLHEADVLRQARKVVVEYGSWERAALALNAEGFLGRGGRPWTRDNLRAKLNWQELLDPKITWRNPKNVKKGKRRGVTLARDGKSSAFGETVTIKLPSIFTREEVLELKRVTVTRAPVTKGRTYTLSRRMRGSAAGTTPEEGEEFRSYRCSGKEPEYAGSPRCDCPNLDAAALEAAVWQQICVMLGDAERLEKLADIQAAKHAKGKVDYAKRIREFERQIEEQYDTIDLTMMVAAKQATRRNLSREDAERAVERAVAP